MLKNARFRRLCHQRLKLTPKVIVVFVLSVALYADVIFQYAKPPSYAERVVDAMTLNFDAYWQACQGHDEYEPQTDKCDDWLGLGITALDSIDTLLFMRLTNRYNMVRKWASDITFTQLNHPKVKDINVFETVIRALGGLNSAYSLSGDDMWLTRALELGDLLLPAFNTYSGCPHSLFNPTTKKGRNYPRLPDNVTGTADAGTLQFEMRTLSTLSGDVRYAKAADRCQRSLVDALPSYRVVPSSFHVTSGRFLRSPETIGAGVDSFLEMLLKTWVAFGEKDAALRRSFESQVDVALLNLVREVNGTYIMGERDHHRRRSVGATMEHLTCFFPGTLALAAMHNLGGGLKSKSSDSYMTWARRLARTCFAMTHSTPEGLAPEISWIAMDGSIQPAIEKSLLRPEIVESLFVLHTITDEPIWRRMAEQMWDSIEKNSILPNGRLTSLQDLGYTAMKPFGKLHSFVLAETLKYFYLIFAEEEKVDMSKMVFSTEAHPVPIRQHPPVRPMA